MHYTYKTFEELVEEGTAFKYDASNYEVIIGTIVISEDNFLHRLYSFEEVLNSGHENLFRQRRMCYNWEEG